jgi:hypothetical protein
MPDGKRWTVQDRFGNSVYLTNERWHHNDTNHIVVIVVFDFTLVDQGVARPNNYVATAFFKHIRLKGTLP